MKEKKFCKFCGEEIDKDSIVCFKCGRQLKTVKKEEIVEKKTEVQKKFYEQQWFMWVMLIFFAPVGIFLMWKFNSEMKKNIKIILSVVFGLLFLIVIFGGSSEETTNNNSYNNSKYVDENDNYENSSSNSTDKQKSYTLGDTIIFDDLELTFDKNYTFTSINNRYSDHNGKSVIKIGINVKNISAEKHSLNMFYYEFFGSQGTELDDVSSYFDNTIDFAGDLKSGASYKKYFYILYDGNGIYSVDFDNYSEQISVEFEIVK